MFQCAGTRSGSRGYANTAVSVARTTSTMGYHLRIAFSPGFGARLRPVEEVFDEVVEHGRIELIDDLLPVALRQNEVGVAQHGEVPRDRGPRRREAFGDLPRRARSVAQQAKDLAPGRVG